MAITTATSTVNPDLPSKASLPRHIRQPEPGSLRHIIIANSSKRLFQPPDVWTPETLRLLGCRFKPLADLAQPTLNPLSRRHGRHNTQQLLPADPEYSELNMCLERLGNSQLPAFRDVNIRDFLISSVTWLRRKQWDTMWKCKRSEKLPLFFDKTLVATVCCPLVVRTKMRTRRVFAFIDHTWMEQEGKKHFTRRTAAKQQKQRLVRGTSKAYKVWAKETPAEPYIAAILIALGQKSRFSKDYAQAYHSSHSVHVFSPAKDRQAIIQYTAAIAPRFLDKFDDPYRYSDCDLVVTQRSIPLSRPDLILHAIEEIFGFTGQGDICKDTVGAPSGDNFAAEPINPTTIAQREALSEVAGNILIPRAPDSSLKRKHVETSPSEGTKISGKKNCQSLEG